MNTNAFLSVEHISSGYENRTILHDICFQVEKHSMTCLLGANGSGKSTLMKCICSIQKHEGMCFLQGEMLEKCTTKQKAKKISYIPQKTGITMSMLVLDVVLMGFNARLSLLEKPHSKHLQKALDVLCDVGLKGYENRDFLTLSEGEKQLVILARMMVEEGSLLLLDEPDSALDFNNRRMLLHKIADFVKKEEKACVLCLHDPALALQYGDQLLLLKEGRCVACIHPQKEDVKTIQKALSLIYENIHIKVFVNKDGKREFALFEGDCICEQ